jgi:hypothetical protein
MTHPMRCKMVVVAAGCPIGCQMIVITVEMRSVCLRLLHQKVCLQGRALKNLRITMILRCCTTNSSIKENGDLLSQLLSCLMQFLLLFNFLYYLVDPLWYFCRNVIYEFS